MEITKIGINVTTEVTYSVTDAPVMLKRYTSTLNFQPDQLRVEFFNGEPTRVKLRGPRVLKSGRRSEETVSEDFGVSWDAESIPDWAKPYLVLDK